MVDPHRATILVALCGLIEPNRRVPPKNVDGSRLHRARVVGADAQE